VVPVIFFANGILSHALSSEAVAAATVKYIEVRIWGIFPAFACAVFRALYIGILKPATLSWAAAIMALLNVILAYAMVFGELGFAPRGIEGAALASVISEFVAMLFLIVATLISKYQRTYGLYYFGWPKWKIIGHTLEISVFTMLQNVMAMGGWLTFFIIIEQSGERALASSNIARSIYIMMMIPLWAFATTTNSLVSNLIGEGNIHLVTKAIKRITLMSLIATALLVIPGSFLPNLILGLYTADASLIVETTPIFYIVMAALIVFSVVIPVYSGVTGTGNTRAGMIIEAITIAAYLLYVYIVVIRFRQGVVVAWLSEFVYFLFMGSLSLAYLRFGKWQKIKI
jgi:Na+-driven multidrug efflux pump